MTFDTFYQSFVIEHKNYNVYVQEDIRESSDKITITVAGENSYSCNVTKDDKAIDRLCCAFRGEKGMTINFDFNDSKLIIKVSHDLIDCDDTYVLELLTKEDISYLNVIGSSIEHRINKLETLCMDKQHYVISQKDFGPCVDIDRYDTIQIIQNIIKDIMTQKCESENGCDLYVQDYNSKFICESHNVKNVQGDVICDCPENVTDIASLFSTIRIKHLHQPMRPTLPTSSLVYDGIIRINIVNRGKTSIQRVKLELHNKKNFFTVLEQIEPIGIVSTIFDKSYRKKPNSCKITIFEPNKVVPNYKKLLSEKIIKMIDQNTIDSSTYYDSCWLLHLPFKLRDGVYMDRLLNSGMYLVRKNKLYDIKKFNGDKFSIDGTELNNASTDSDESGDEDVETNESVIHDNVIRKINFYFANEDLILDVQHDQHDQK